MQARGQNTPGKYNTPTHFAILAGQGAPPASHILKQPQQVITPLTLLPRLSIPMPQLLPRRRRRTGPTQIHPLKPAHQIVQPTPARRGAADSSTSQTTTGRGYSCRCRRVKQPHDICHPSAGRRRSAGGDRTRHPVGSSGPRGILLGACRRSPVEIDIQQVLDVVLLRPAASRSVGGSRGGHGRGNGVLGEVLPLFLDGGALDGLGADAALTDERLGWFVVDRGEGGKLCEEMLEENGRETVDGSGDGRLLSEDDAL